MSTLAPPAPPSAAGTPEPPLAKGRRTLLGFVGTRHVRRDHPHRRARSRRWPTAVRRALRARHGSQSARRAGHLVSGEGQRRARAPPSSPTSGGPRAKRVDTGPKAKAYANGFIRRHLETVAGGKTYSQVSALRARRARRTRSWPVRSRPCSRARPCVDFLLYAWGWSVVSTISLYAGIAALLGFVIMLFATLGDFIADPRSPPVTSRREHPRVRAARSGLRERSSSSCAFASTRARSAWAPFAATSRHALPLTPSTTPSTAARGPVSLSLTVHSLVECVSRCREIPAIDARSIESRAR